MNTRHERERECVCEREREREEGKMGGERECVRRVREREK
jgi:hypothetical protein